MQRPRPVTRALGCQSEGGHDHGGGSSRGRRRWPPDRCGDARPSRSRSSEPSDPGDVVRTAASSGQPSRERRRGRRGRCRGGSRRAARTARSAAPRPGAGRRRSPPPSLSTTTIVRSTAGARSATSAAESCRNAMSPMSSAVGAAGQGHPDRGRDDTVDPVGAAVGVDGRARRVARRTTPGRAPASTTRPPAWPRRARRRPACGRSPARSAGCPPSSAASAPWAACSARRHRASHGVPDAPRTTAVELRHTRAAGSATTRNASRGRVDPRSRRRHLDLLGARGPPTRRAPSRPAACRSAARPPARGRRRSRGGAAGRRRRRPSSPAAIGSPSADRRAPANRAARRARGSPRRLGRCRLPRRRRSPPAGGRAERDQPPGRRRSSRRGRRADGDPRARRSRRRQRAGLTDQRLPERQVEVHRPGRGAGRSHGPARERSPRGRLGPLGHARVVEPAHRRPVERGSGRSVWGAPTSRSSGGRSAVHTTSGTSA